MLSLATLRLYMKHRNLSRRTFRCNGEDNRRWRSHRDWTIYSPRRRRSSASSSATRDSASCGRCAHARPWRARAQPEARRPADRQALPHDRPNPWFAPLLRLTWTVGRSELSAGASDASARLRQQEQQSRPRMRCVAYQRVNFERFEAPCAPTPSALGIVPWAFGISSRP